MLDFISKLFFTYPGANLAFPIPIASLAIFALGSVIKGITGAIAGKEREKGLKKAEAALQEAYGLSAEETKKALQPFQQLGVQQQQFFTQLGQEPGALADIYAKYAETLDPLYQFYAQRGREAVSRRQLARGQYGAGAGRQQFAEFEAQLGGQFAQLAGQRAQQEIALRSGLLGAGQQAAQFGAGQLGGIYGGLGRGLAGIYGQIGEARGQAIEGIGGGILGGIQAGLTYGGTPPGQPVQQQYGQYPGTFGLA